MLMCAVTRFVWINLIVLLPSRRTDSKTLLVVHWLSYAFLVIIVALSFFSIPVSRLSIGREPFFITRVAFTCLGLVILLFFNLCFLSAIFTILWFFKCRFPNANKWKAVLASAVSIFLCIHGLSAASKGPSVVGETIPLAKLPPSFYGTTIVQLSDIHLGPMVGSADLERVVNRVLMIKPDIVVITGDLVDSTVEKLKQVVLPLKKLSSRYGVFFVTGKPSWEDFCTTPYIYYECSNFILQWKALLCRLYCTYSTFFQLPYKLFIPISKALPGGGGGPMAPVWILKRFVSMFINACLLLSALPSLSQFGRGRLSLVAISFYVLSLLFGQFHLSEFTLAGPHKRPAKLRTPFSQPEGVRSLKLPLYFIQIQ